MQLRPVPIPGNRQKTLQNAESYADVRFFRVELCSVHENSLEDVFEWMFLRRLRQSEKQRACQQRPETNEKELWLTREK